jgi:hypothetical protein
VQRVGAAIDGPEAVVFVAAEDHDVSVISQRLEERLGAKADYLVLTEEETAEIQAGLH